MPLNVTLNANATQLNNELYRAQNDIINLQADLAAAQGQIDDNTAKIADLQSQIEALSGVVISLQSRLDAVETRQTLQGAAILTLQTKVNSLIAGQVFIGPYIGVEVHLRSSEGECIPAIIIRDPSQSQTANLISVLHLVSRRNEPAYWASAWDIPPDSPEMAPMTGWHQPENTLVIR